MEKTTRRTILKVTIKDMELKPYVRFTQRNKNFGYARAYLENRSKISQIIKETFNQENKINEKIGLNLRIEGNNVRYDIDNGIKAIMDSLQGKEGIIENDFLIKKITAEVRNKEKNKIIIKIYSYSEKTARKEEK